MRRTTPSLQEWEGATAMLGPITLILAALLLLLACTTAPRAASPSPSPLVPTAAALSVPSVAPTTTTPAPPASPTSAGPAIDTRLAGQTRYIANTEGIGVKARTTCDEQIGSTGWPEGAQVTVVYGRADCPEWLLVKRS